MNPMVAPAILAAAVLMAASRGVDEKKEPPQIFTLEVDGKRIPVELDKPVELATKAPSTRVVLRTEPYRVFAYSGLRFHYPRDMGFEANIDTPSLRMWTLDGNDAILMVHRYEGEPDPVAARRTFVDAVVEQHGGAAVKKEDARLMLGKRELAGTTIRVRFAGTRITQAVYSFRAGGDTILLILQDSPGDDGSPSEEYARVLKMLQETFRFPVDGE